ncbi:MAG: hypothetical protein HFE25_05765 [Clostridia bacterium]|jgi:hypothetical protein|nr:hypothetical protein [Clostridia bacterium]
MKNFFCFYPLLGSPFCVDIYATASSKSFPLHFLIDTSLFTAAFIKFIFIIPPLGSTLCADFFYATASSKSFPLYFLIDTSLFTAPFFNRRTFLCARRSNLLLKDKRLHIRGAAHIQ